MSETTQPKTHWKKLTNPKYVGSHDILPLKEITVTIESIFKEMVKNANGAEECVVCYFKGGKKPMILNKTNLNILNKKFDTYLITLFPSANMIILVMSYYVYNQSNSFSIVLGVFILIGMFVGSFHIYYRLSNLENTLSFPIDAKYIMKERIPSNLEREANLKREIQLENKTEDFFHWKS